MKDLNQIMKITFNMPKSIPAGYAIKVALTQNTLRYGTAFINLESLEHTTVYEYPSSSYFIMRSMGPIPEGTLVSITFKTYKNSVTDFIVEVFIDTEEIIDANSASSYMFYGNSEERSESYHHFLHNVYDSIIWESERIANYITSSSYVRLQIYPYSSWGISTSSGAYLEFYFPPTV